MKVAFLVANAQKRNAAGRRSAGNKHSPEAIPLVRRDTPHEEEFWQYFVDDSRHDFYPAGSEQEQRAFAMPPWE
jgi:hypothetical protein